MFVFSILCLQESFDQLSVTPAAAGESSPAISLPIQEAAAITAALAGSNVICSESGIPQSVEFRTPCSPHRQDSSDFPDQGGTEHCRVPVGDRSLMTGLLGCLRPVWTFIGKATTNELKAAANKG